MGLSFFEEVDSPCSSQPASEPSTPDTSKSVLFEEFAEYIENDSYILVTGGLGFIGSHTSVELLKAGHNVIIVDDLSNSFKSVFDRILTVANRHFERVGGQCPRIKLYDINYRDMPSMTALLESYVRINPWDQSRISAIAGVIHFAAFKAVEESIKHPLKYYQNNINGLVDILGLLDEFNIKTFIFSSSATVYGTLADKGFPLKEEHTVHKKTNFIGHSGGKETTEQGCTGLTNPYGKTKFFGESILSDLAFSDPSWTIVALRYFNPVGCDETGLLGEDPKGVPSNLLPVVVKVMTGQWKELSIFGSDWETPDGTAIRDFIHVTDLARGHIAALSTALEGRLRENFRTFNLGTGAGHSVKDIVETMESVSQLPIARKLVDRRAGDVGSCVAVADRAAMELGWKTEKSLRNACQDICNFLKVNES